MCILGSMLIFGLFISWESRHIQQEYNNSIILFLSILIINIFLLY